MQQFTAETLRNIARQFLKSNPGIVLPEMATIVEMGPRDGLQNEKTILDTPFKIEFINQLSQTGLHRIEVTSFVSPKWVPQMADNKDVYLSIDKSDSVRYSALVPNIKGMDTAELVDCQEIAVFTGASEGFVKKNINCSIDESFERFEPVIERAKQKGTPVRGYVSCVMGCPYDGEVDPVDVDYVTNRLLEMGCYEVSLGDTIGAGTPEKTEALMNAISAPRERLAAHFHDTNKTAIQNILVALKHGIKIFDSSVGGLGGCPYAGKPAGNVSSEDVIFVLNEIGIDTGVNLEQMINIGNYVSSHLNRENLSVVTRNDL